MDVIAVQNKNIQHTVHILPNLTPLLTGLLRLLAWFLLSVSLLCIHASIALFRDSTFCYNKYASLSFPKPFGTAIKHFNTDDYYLAVI